MKIQLLILNIIAVLFSACTNVDSANAQVVKHVSAQEFNHIIDAGNGVILDVRTPQEVATGHLKNASIINYYDSDFEEKLGLIQKDKEVYVYCRSGGRSAKAAKSLVRLGHPKVINLKGGIGAWKAEKLPITLPTISNDENINTLSTEEFDTLLLENEIVLVDFHTQWCVPCKKMSPIIDEIEKEYKEKAMVLRVDLDSSMDLAKKYSVVSVPTFIVFKSSSEVWRNSGLLSKEKLTSILDRYSTK